MLITIIQNNNVIWGIVVENLTKSKRIEYRNIIFDDEKGNLKVLCKFPVHLEISSLFYETVEQINYEKKYNFDKEIWEKTKED